MNLVTSNVVPYIIKTKQKHFLNEKQSKNTSLTCLHKLGMHCIFLFIQMLTKDDPACRSALLTIAGALTKRARPVQEEQCLAAHIRRNSGLPNLVRKHRFSLCG